MHLSRLLLVAVGIAITPQQGHAGTATTQPGGSILRTEPRQDPNRRVTQPEYPQSAVAALQEGTIILRFQVEPNGTVDPRSITMQESTGVRSLDEAAMEEATRWHFLPATENGQPIESEHQFRVVFELAKAGGGFGLPMSAESPQGPLAKEPEGYESFVPLNGDTRGNADF